MKDALKKKPVAEFPAPPENALTPIECPDFIETDLEEIPFGCPSRNSQRVWSGKHGLRPSSYRFKSTGSPAPVDPTATNEFGPEPAPTRSSTG